VARECDITGSGEIAPAAPRSAAIGRQRRYGRLSVTPD
jgi:hypothetical protein